jgi:hypothetical protein
MKLLRALFLLIMVLLLFLMISLPGLQDTKQMATAWKHYHDSPSDATQREIENARIADRKQMVKIEEVLGTFLALTTILFSKTGKKSN